MTRTEDVLRLEEIADEIYDKLYETGGIEMTDKEFFERLFMEYLRAKTKPEDYFDEDDDESELDSFFDMVFRIGWMVILLLLWILL